MLIYVLSLESRYLYHSLYPSRSSLAASRSVEPAKHKRRRATGDTDGAHGAGAGNAAIDGRGMTGSVGGWIGNSSWSIQHTNDSPY